MTAGSLFGLWLAERLDIRHLDVKLTGRYPCCVVDEHPDEKWPNGETMHIDGITIRDQGKITVYLHATDPNYLATLAHEAIHIANGDQWRDIPEETLLATRDPRSYEYRIQEKAMKLVEEWKKECQN